MKYNIDYGITNLIPEKIAKEYKCMPINIWQNKLSIAVSNDSSVDNFTLIREYFNKMGISQIDLLSVAEVEIERLINTYYAIEFENYDIRCEMEKIRNNRDSKALFEYILLKAIELKSSDIHMMFEDDFFVIRFRIKGKLKTFAMIDKLWGENVVRVLKVKSNIEVSKTKSPKDSRMKFYLEKEEIDIRVSVVNTIQNEKISLRILNNQDIPLNLSELELNDYEKNIIKRTIFLNSGFVLICGPTGSGKSTTLRCLLNELNDAKRHIVSIEDPIEYTMKGITQIQVDNSAENAFNKALRYIVRQDPDVIYIGEIRDFESADVATKASLTGHLVFSTLHTRDANSAMERMQNLGIDRETLKSSINLIINQRLVGLLCENCKHKVIYKGSCIEELAIKPGSETYEAVGCEVCGYSGYEKVVPIIEVLIFNEDLETGALFEKIFKLLHLGKIELKEALKYLWY